MEPADSWWRGTMQGLMAEFYDGPHATPDPASEGPIYLGIKNLSEDGHLDLTSIRHVSEADYPRWVRRVEPRAGDLVFTYEASLHRYAILPDAFRGCLGRRLALIRPNPVLVDTRYLLYYFLSPIWRATVTQRINVGSTVDRIPLIEFPEFPVAVPGLDSQRRIVGVLSAYDELIENNTRRIQILEEMAQAIYREWFVDFRYPGHEDVPLVDSDLGPIPEGWESVSFAGLGDYLNGFAFKPSHWGDSGLPIVKIKELKAGVNQDTPRYLGADVPQKYLIGDGNLLFSWSAHLDAYIWSGGDAWLNQHLFLVTPNDDVPTLFLFHALRDRMGEFRARSQGTTMKHIKRAALSEVRVAVPAGGLPAAFETHVAPLDSLRLNLVAANANLRTTRDLLLPRLISGEIDVSDLDIDVGDAAA